MKGTFINTNAPVIDQQSFSRNIRMLMLTTIKVLLLFPFSFLNMIYQTSGKKIICVPLSVIITPLISLVSVSSYMCILATGI